MLIAAASFDAALLWAILRMAGQARAYESVKSRGDAAAGGDARLRVIPGGALPSGRTVKANACAQGADGVSAETWLCFMDADTRAESGMVRVAVAEAVRRRVGLLSLESLQGRGGAIARDGEVERPRGAEDLTPGTHAETLWNEGKLKGWLAR